MVKPTLCKECEERGWCWGGLARSGEQESITKTIGAEYHCMGKVEMMRMGWGKGWAIAINNNLHPTWREESRVSELDRTENEGCGSQSMEMS